MSLEKTQNDSFTIVLTLFGINNQKVINPNHASPLRMPVIHQCWVCGKRWNTLDEAEKCHNGPTQSIETKVKRDVYRTFYGNMIRKDKKN
jgi:hypothetical protein